MESDLGDLTGELGNRKELKLPISGAEHNMSLRSECHV